MEFLVEERIAQRAQVGTTVRCSGAEDTKMGGELCVCLCVHICIGRAAMARWASVQSLSCVRLCNPMNRSTPGLPVHHQLLEFTQTHVH